MRERVEAAHRALTQRMDGVREAFRAGGVEGARAAFQSLREELETHFEQEDSLYFPTIRALRPDTREAVARISAAHGQFRATFAEIAARIVEGSLEEASAHFETFAEAFAHHEALEEALLASIVPAGDQPPARPAG